MNLKNNQLIFIIKKAVSYKTDSVCPQAIKLTPPLPTLWKFQLEFHVEMYANTFFICVLVMSV